MYLPIPYFPAAIASPACYTPLVVSNANPVLTGTDKLDALDISVPKYRFPECRRDLPCIVIQFTNFKERRGAPLPLIS